MNVLLLVVGIIFLISALVGYKKGFIKIVASLLAVVISIILVAVATPYVSGWIRQVTPLEESIQKKCAEFLIPGAEDSENIETDVPREEQMSLIDNANLPQAFKDMLNGNNNPVVYEALGVDSFVQYVGAYIAKLISDIIAFLITFIFVTIALRIIMKVLGIIDKIPVIGGMNRLAGGAIGLVIGLLIVWIVLIVVTLLYNTPIGMKCFEYIAESPILTRLYEGNILMNNITKF